MFTGIIQHTGICTRSGTQVTVSSNMDLADVSAGDSIAVNGVCLTTLQDQTLLFDLGLETLDKTTLGHLAQGSRVHLEKAIRFSDRLGGHLVQGHVDGIGHLVKRQTNQESLELTFETSPEILNLCIPKGSITINGVSLTINQIGSNSFGVCLVPHTLEKTQLGQLQIGNTVNLENDLIGKYILQFSKLISK